MALSQALACRREWVARRVRLRIILLDQTILPGQTLEQRLPCLQARPLRTEYSHDAPARLLPAGYVSSCRLSGGDFHDISNESACGISKCSHSSLGRHNNHASAGPRYSTWFHSADNASWHDAPSWISASARGAAGSAGWFVQYSADTDASPRLSNASTGLGASGWLRFPRKSTVPKIKWPLTIRHQVARPGSLYLICRACDNFLPVLPSASVSCGCGRQACCRPACKAGPQRRTLNQRMHPVVPTLGHSVENPAQFPKMDELTSLSIPPDLPPSIVLPCWSLSNREHTNCGVGCQDQSGQRTA